MSPRAAVTAIAVALTLAATGCVSAMVTAMRDAEVAFKDAEAKSKSGEFANADARISDLETLFGERTVSEHIVSEGYSAVRLALLGELGTLRGALQAENADEAKAGFGAAFEACEACHRRY